MQKSSAETFKAKKRRRNRIIIFSFWSLARLAAIFAIVVGVLWIATDRIGRISALKAQIAQVEAQIESQINIRTDLNEQADFTQSTAFIEGIARRFFGLVHRDEIIFTIVSDTYD